MRIPFYFLCEQLQGDTNFQVSVVPASSVSLGRPRFLLTGQAPEPDRLYVRSLTEPVPAQGAVPPSSAILTALEPTRLLNRLQELFDLCESWESALAACAATGELRELMDEIETILGNPVLLHKSNYAIVACSAEVFSNPMLSALRGTHLPYDYVNGLKLDPQYETIQSSPAPFFFSVPQARTPALGMNIFPESEASYRLTVLPLHRPLVDSDRFLMELCTSYAAQALRNTVISGRYADPTGRKERLVELFRTGVETENADPTVLEQGFSALGWLPSHQYACLAIQLGTPDPLSHTLELLCNQLEILLPCACVFTHLGTIAVLIDLNLSNAGIRELLEKCVYFFRDNDLRTGVSNLFTGFQNLRSCHKQALIALNFASRPQAFLWVQYFSDVVLDYILEQSNRELPLQLICSPQILEIRQYDKLHQTDFYAPLECYIQNKFNAVQTAKELQIHRSTFLYRMERLQNLFHLDLNQRDSLLYTLLSMKMLELSKSMMIHE